MTHSKQKTPGDLFHYAAPHRRAHQPEALRLRVSAGVRDSRYDLVVYQDLIVSAADDARARIVISGSLTQAGDREIALAGAAEAEDSL